MTPWDNPTVDGIVWVVAVLAVMRLLWWAAGRMGEWAGSAPADEWEPHPPVSEPIRHVKESPPVPLSDFDASLQADLSDLLHISIFSSYRAQLGHSPFCRSADGTELTCECEVSA